MDRKLVKFLRKRGALDSEIEQAADEGWLVLLTVDRTLLPGRPSLDSDEIAERAGIDPELAARLWRALGFPDPPDDVPVFTEEGVEALRIVTERLRNPFFTDEHSDDAIVAQVRGVAAGLTRVAEVLSDQIAEAVEAGRTLGLDEESIAVGMVDALDWSTIARLTDYALRQQLRAAVWRKLIAEQGADQSTPTTELVVGFLDLVGYTALSQELDADELSELVDRFEALTRDTVAELGGRVVKTIGDEVMYVAEDTAQAATIALRLTERTGTDEVLPLARAGLARGTVLARDGDYYGPVVNLAHRLVELARPGSVVTSEEVREALADDPGFAWQRLRSRKIRDIGRVEVWALRAGAPAAAE